MTRGKRHKWNTAGQRQQIRKTDPANSKDDNQRTQSSEVTSTIDETCDDLAANRIANMAVEIFRDFGLSASMVEDFYKEHPLDAPLVAVGQPPSPPRPSESPQWPPFSLFLDELSPPTALETVLAATPPTAKVAAKESKDEEKTTQKTPKKQRSSKKKKTPKKRSDDSPES